jgi:ElaB/YqjD/DUF883 family membrane-anchored ribosome-binding protein
MSEKVEQSEDLKEAVDEVKGAVSNLAGQVKKDLGRQSDDVKETVTKKVEEVRDELGSRVGQAREYATDRYGVAREGLKTGYDRARKDFDQLSGDVNTYVRDNPGRSVLIAAGLGFLVGLLVRNRSY